MLLILLTAANSYFEGVSV